MASALQITLQRRCGSMQPKLSPICALTVDMPLSFTPAALVLTGRAFARTAFNRHLLAEYHNQYLHGFCSFVDIAGVNICMASVVLLFIAGVVLRYMCSLKTE